ncbi:MAG: hypothetical protein ABWK00_03025 [Desulfurococcaceae archaeon]
MRRRALAVAVLLAANLALRAVPQAIEGVPFSTDAWGPLRNSEVLLRHSPIALTSELFDGYNNFWPANSIAVAVASLLAGIDVERALELVIVASAAALCLVLARGGPPLLLACAYLGFVEMGAGLTKEGYAYPLAALGVALAVGSRRRADMLAAIPALAALPLAHHLTTLALLASFAALMLFGALEELARPAPSDGPLAARKVAPAFALLAAMAIAHYLALGRGGAPLELTPWLATSSALHVVLLSWIVSLAPRPRGLGALARALTYVAASAFPALIAASWPGLTPPEKALLALMASSYAATMVALAAEPALLAGRFAGALMALGPASLALFALDEGLPLSTSIAYRVLGPTLLVALSCATALRSQWRWRAVAIAAAALAASSIASFALAGAGVAPSLGYYWWYSREEVVNAGIIAAHLPPGAGLESDVKQASLLWGLYAVRATAAAGPGACFLYYKYMSNVGELLGVAITAKIASPAPRGPIVFSSDNALLVGPCSSS